MALYKPRFVEDHVRLTSLVLGSSKAPRPTKKTKTKGDAKKDNEGMDSYKPRFV